jgi:O-antigen ligase
MQLGFALMIGTALIGRLGLVPGLQLVIRSMAFVCVISFVWCVTMPDIAVHQATDRGQTVHVGLWRGVFSHKITLGCFAAMTLSLLLFYGWRAFSNPLTYLVAVVCALVCIVKAGSATALVTCVVMLGLLVLTHHIALRHGSLRRALIRISMIGSALFLLAMFTGALNMLSELLGRSSDLTGRTDIWNALLGYIHANNWVTGYGFSAGIDFVSLMVMSSFGDFVGEAHNGFLEMVVAFGYPGAILVYGVLIMMLVKSRRLMASVPPFAVKVSVFPFCFLVTFLSSSYAESIVLEFRGLWTITLGLTIAMMARISIFLESSGNGSEVGRGARTEGGSLSAQAGAAEVVGADREREKLHAD